MAGVVKRPLFHSWSWKKVFLPMLQQQLFISNGSRQSGVFTNARQFSNDNKGTDSGTAAVQEQDGIYQVPEYFQYNEFSYYDIDIKMLEHRMEQPKPGLKY